MKNKPHVRLAMMVRANPDDVLRAIESASPFIDSVCLVVAPGDPLVSLALPIAGSIIEEPWVNHAQNRAKTLAHAEADPAVDWIVMLDADDVFAPGSTLPNLQEADVDTFEIPIDYVFPGGHWRWLRAGHLMRTRSGFSWSGTGNTGLHEVLTVPPAKKLGRWDGLVCQTIVRKSDNESSNQVRAGERTYEQDAKKFEESLTAHDDPRSQFYYAQSLKDSGQYENAYKAFQARAEMIGFYEDTFWAKLWSAKLAPLIGRDFSECLVKCIEAHVYLPERAEPLLELATCLELHKQMTAAIGMRAIAAMKPYPLSARSFVDVTSYSDASLKAAGITRMTV